jgi:hypothetical protein
VEDSGEGAGKQMGALVRCRVDCQVGTREAREAHEAAACWRMGLMRST